MSAGMYPLIAFGDVHAAGKRGSSLHGWIYGVPRKELTDAAVEWGLRCGVL